MNVCSLVSALGVSEERILENLLNAGKDLIRQLFCTTWKWWSLQAGGNIQANFPFPWALQGKIEVAGGHTGLDIVGKTHLCLLLLIPTLQNAHVFQIAKLAFHLNSLSASCAISVGSWESKCSGVGWWPEHKMSCSVKTKSLLLVTRKCYFPWQCSVLRMLLCV